MFSRPSWRNTLTPGFLASSSLTTGDVSTGSIRKGDARRKFDQIINEFPDSNLAGEAKRISEALAESGN